MIVCFQDQGIVYIWSATWNEPRIFTAPLGKVVGRFEARWVARSGLDDSLQASAETSQSTILFSDSSRYVLGYLQLADGASASEVERGAPQLGLSRTGVGNQDEGSLPNEVFSNVNSPAGKTDQYSDMSQGKVDDTFQHRHQHFTEAA